MNIGKKVQRGLAVVTISAAALLTGATAASAMPPPWSHQGTYSSYEVCARMGSQLMSFGVVRDWVCNLYGDNDPTHDLWVIWK
jgi:hypothetical protein